MDAVIYYTTDGSNPSNNSAIFDKNNPIKIDETSTIKTKATKNGMTASKIIGKQFVLGESDKPTISYKFADAKLTITDTAPNNTSAIYYTFDGDDPTLSSKKYSQPFIPEPTSRRENPLDNKEVNSEYTINIAMKQYFTTGYFQQKTIL